MDTKRVHRWIYGLWYPALLGAFAIAIVSGRSNASPSYPYWEWLVVAYLTAQFGEGSDPNRDYDRRALLQDLCEVALMLGFFVAMQYPFGSYGWLALLRTDDGPRWVFAALFLVPPAFRGIRWLLAGDAEQRVMRASCAFQWALCVLSAAVAVLGSVFAQSHAALYLAWVIFAVYLFCFVLFGLPRKEPPSRWRRPTAREIAQARKKDREPKPPKAPTPATAASLKEAAEEAANSPKPPPPAPEAPEPAAATVPKPAAGAPKEKADGKKAEAAGKT